MKPLEKTGLIVAFALCLVGVARAQTQPWDENRLTWVAPTQCEDNQPVSACPVTGYRVEQSATATGTFTTLATVGTVLTYSHTGVSAGQHCYRVFALSNSGDSAASNTSCKTNVRPPSPPKPPVLTIAALAGLEIPLDSLDGFKRTPVFSITANGPGVLLGFCKAGTPSVQDNVFTYRGEKYCKPLLNHPRTGAPNIAWIKGVTPSPDVAASCA